MKTIFTWLFIFKIQSSIWSDNDKFFLEWRSDGSLVWSRGDSIGKWKLQNKPRVKLNLSSPPIMGHDQMEKLHNVILDSDIDVLHLRPKNPEKLTGASYQDIEKFKELTESFVKWVFQDHKMFLKQSSVNRLPKLVAKWIMLMGTITFLWTIQSKLPKKSPNSYLRLFYLD